MGIQQELLNSMKIVTDAAVAKVKFDETVIAEIISQDTVDKTKYKVKYQNRELYAYSNDTSKTYKEEQGVYLLLPKNEDAKKLILGEYKDETDTRTYNDKYDDMIVIAFSGSKYTPNTPFVQPIGQNKLGINNYVKGYSSFVTNVNDINKYPGSGPWYEPKYLFDDCLYTEETINKATKDIAPGNGRMGGFVKYDSTPGLPDKKIGGTNYYPFPALRFENGNTLSYTGRAMMVWNIEKTTIDQIVIVGSPSDSQEFNYEGNLCDNKNIITYGIYAGNDLKTIFSNAGDNDNDTTVTTYNCKDVKSRQFEHFIKLKNPIKDKQYLGIVIPTAAYGFVRLSEIGAYNSQEINMLSVEKDELIVYPKLKNDYETALNNEANRVSIQNLDGTDYKIKYEDEQGNIESDDTPKYTDAEKEIKRQETEELPEEEAKLQSQINELNNIALDPNNKGKELNDIPEYITAEREKERLEQYIKTAKEIIAENKKKLQQAFNKTDLKNFQSISDGAVKFYIEDLTNNSTLAKDKPYDYLGLEFIIETENTEEYIGGSYSLLITVPAGQAGLTEDVLIHEINSKTFFGNPYSFEGGFGQKVVINFPSKILSLENGTEPVKYIEVRLSQNNDFEMPKNQGGQEVNPEASVKAYGFSMRAGYDISSFNESEAIAYIEDESKLHYTSSDIGRTVRALVIKEEEGTNQFKAINEFKGRWQETTRAELDEAKASYEEDISDAALTCFSYNNRTTVIKEKPESASDSTWAEYQNKIKAAEVIYRKACEDAMSDEAAAIKDGSLKAGYILRWYNKTPVADAGGQSDEFGGEGWAHETEDENKLSCDIYCDINEPTDEVKFVVLEVAVPASESEVTEGEDSNEIKKTSETVKYEAWPIEHLEPPAASTATVIYESNRLEFINDSYTPAVREISTFTLELADGNKNFIGAYDPNSNGLIDKRNNKYKINLLLPADQNIESFKNCSVEWIFPQGSTLIAGLVDEETEERIYITDKNLYETDWRSLEFKLKEQYFEGATNNIIQCVIRDAFGKSIQTNNIKLSIGYAVQQGLNYTLRIEPIGFEDDSQKEIKDKLCANAKSDELELKLYLYNGENGLIEIANKDSITWGFEGEPCSFVNGSNKKAGDDALVKCEQNKNEKEKAVFKYTNTAKGDYTNYTHHYIAKATCKVPFESDKSGNERILTAYYPIPFYNPTAIRKRVGAADYQKECTGVYAQGLYTLSWNGEGEWLDEGKSLREYAIQVADNNGKLHDLSQNSFEDFNGVNKTPPQQNLDYGMEPQWKVDSLNSTYNQIFGEYVKAEEKVSKYDYIVKRVYDNKTNKFKKASQIENWKEYKKDRYCDLFNATSSKTRYKLQIYDSSKGEDFNEHSIFDISRRDYTVKDSSGKIISSGVKNRAAYKLNKKLPLVTKNGTESEINCTSIRGEVAKVDEEVKYYKNKRPKTVISRVFLKDPYATYDDNKIDKVGPSITDCWVTVVIKFKNKDNSPIDKVYTKFYLQKNTEAKLPFTTMPSEPVCIACYDNNSNDIYYQRPLLNKLNVYKAGWLNDWAGATITMNETEGTILAAAMGAGRKELDNSFSGVLMGEVVTPNSNSYDKFLGLYGVNSGQKTFSLDAETGNLILGKSGGGQMIFDANSGILKIGQSKKGYITLKSNENFIISAQKQTGENLDSYWDLTSNIFQINKITFNTLYTEYKTSNNNWDGTIKIGGATDNYCFEISSNKSVVLKGYNSYSVAIGSPSPNFDDQTISGTLHLEASSALLRDIYSTRMFLTSSYVTPSLENHHVRGIFKYNNKRRLIGVDSQGNTCLGDGKDSDHHVYIFANKDKMIKLAVADSFFDGAEFYSKDQQTQKITNTVNESVQDATKLRASQNGGRLYGTWHLNDGDTAVTSDINKKNTISPLSNNYSILFDNLKPVTYKYNNGTSNRLHTGFIAQEVEKALYKANLSTRDFAGLINNGEEEDELGVYSLRYSEFIALNTHEIQKLKARVNELENKLALLESK